MTKTGPLLVIGILVLVVAFFIFSSLNSFPAKENETTGATPSRAAETPVVQLPANTAFKDGTYQARGDYNSPGGLQSILVSITLENSVISNVLVTPEGSDPQSFNYERAFASGISEVVVGKKLTDVKTVGIVNGSSLTGAGFIKALATIANQAKQ